MICPRCGTENRDEARFCDACGYSLSQTAPVEPFSLFETNSDALTAELPGEEGEDAHLEEMWDDPSSVTEDIPDGRYFGEVSSLEADVTVPYPLDPSLIKPPSPGTLPPSETQEMPSVVEVADTQQKAYRSQGKSKRPWGTTRSRRLSNKAIIGLIVGVLVLVAALGGGAYALELWGGKSVPNVVGLTEAEAIDRLETAGFSTSTVSVKSDDVEGIVLRTDPAAGRRAEPGSEIVLDVSCARTIPEVMGKTTEEALSQLKAEGFDAVEVIEEKSNETAGTIIAVSPEVGTRAKASAKITLTAAIPFLVPACANMTADEAAEALEAEGYTAAMAYSYTEEVAEGLVVGTDPEAGTALPSGSEVTVFIAKSRAAEVTAFAREWFSRSAHYAMGGMSYELQSVDGITYEGDDTCSFAITMRPYETHSWFGSEPETRYGNSQTVRGTMRFSQDGALASINPDIKPI